MKDNFAEYWKDNFILASLGAKKLYRIKFDNNYTKVLFVEEIYIGERIRDLYYDEQNSIIFMALEDSGSLGLLKLSNI